MRCTTTWRRRRSRCKPQLGEVIEAGIEPGALAGIVSGSGPTVAFLAADQESALHLAIALTASGTSRQVRQAVGPAQGPPRRAGRSALMPLLLTLDRVHVVAGVQVVPRRGLPGRIDR